MLAAFSFRALLLAAAAALLLPVAGLFTYQAYSASRDAITAAQRESLTLAQVIGARYRAFLTDTERVLQVLAQRPQVRAMDPARCDPLLSQIHAALPLFANVSVIARDLTVVCSAVTRPRGQHALRSHIPGAGESMDQRGLVASEPYVGLITGRLSFALSYPVIAANGRVAGRMVVSVDIQSWHALLAQAQIPEGTTLTVVSPKGVLLARLPAVPELLGRSVADTEAVRFALQHDTGVTTDRDVDGVRRVTGYTIVPDTGWRVYAGRPETEVLTPIYAGALRGGAMLLAALSLLALFVALLCQWLAHSVAALNAVTQVLALDDGATHVPLAGPRELRQAIASVNAMSALRLETNRSLRESREQFREIAETISEVFWSADPVSGVVHYISPGYERIWGRSRASLYVTSRSLLDGVHEGDRDRVRVALGEREKGEAFAHEYRVVHVDGTVRWVWEHGYPVRDPVDSRLLRYVGVAVDITERKRVADVSREREQFLSAIMDHFPGLIAARDLTGTLILANSKFALLDANDLAAQPEGAAIEAEQVVAHRDGTLHVYLTSTFPLTKGVAVFATGAISIDITKRKRAEMALRGSELELRHTASRLRELSRRLIETQEVEWRRLSVELHDRVGQNLAALSINLDLIGTVLPPSTSKKLTPRLGDMRSLLESTIASVRDLITELSPTVLEAYGLMAGLRQLAQQFEDRAGFAVRIEGDDPVPRLARPVEGALFRIAQEALTNTAKHAQAHHASVGLRCEHGGFALTIADDGVGFDPNVTEEADQHTHWGVTLMQERAEFVGGRLQVQSTPGQGTRIVVERGRAA